jgi:hypothetical protein
MTRLEQIDTRLAEIAKLMAPHLALIDELRKESDQLSQEKSRLGLEEQLTQANAELPRLSDDAYFGDAVQLAAHELINDAYPLTGRDFVNRTYDFLWHLHPTTPAYDALEEWVFQGGLAPVYKFFAGREMMQ